MIVVDKLLKNKFLFSLFLLSIFVAQFYNLLFHPDPANIDHGVIIAPLEKINSLYDYLLMYLEQKMTDIQPIRDFSHLIDLYLQRVTNINFMIFSNVIYWWLSVLALLSLLKELVESKIIKLEDIKLKLIMIVFSLHPIFIWTVGWGSTRKHILSFMFILLTFRYFFRFLRHQNRQNYYSILVFYLLSIYSQPITILWPVWALLYICMENFWQKKNVYLLIFLFILLSICALQNYHYYNVIYPIQTASNKFTENHLSFKFFSFFKHYYQIFFPMHLSSNYSENSIRNFYGPFIAVLFHYLAFRLVSLKQQLIWFGVFVFPIAILLVKNTQIFYFDAYSLLPSVGILMLIILLMQNPIIKKQKMLKYLSLLMFIVLAPSFIVMNFKNLKAYESSLALHRKSAEEEPICWNFVNLAMSEFYYSKQVKSFEGLMSYIIKNGCLVASKHYTPVVNYLYSASLYLNSKISEDEKIKILERKYGHNYVFQYLYHFYKFKRDRKKVDGDKFYELVVQILPKVRFEINDRFLFGLIHEVEESDFYFKEKLLNELSRVKMNYYIKKSKNIAL